MKTLFTFTTPTETCGYLPDREWNLRYEVVGELTAAEYEERMKLGWRRFGKAMFRPQCQHCQACRPLRVILAELELTTSLRRVLNKCDNAVSLGIHAPEATPEKLQLYNAFHEFQRGFKDWPRREHESEASYAESFVDNPFPTEEWQYRIGDQLVGVGYVDVLPESLSMIYFFYDPAFRDYSLGTFNVLMGLAEAKRRNRPHLNLGYFVEGCRSLEYKARFRSNEVFDWQSETWNRYRK